MTDATDHARALGLRSAAKRASKPRSLSCRVCGKPFVATAPLALYCSATCRQRAFQRKKRGKAT